MSDTCHILPLDVTTTAEEIGATRAFTNKHVTFFSVYTATGRETAAPHATRQDYVRDFASD